MCPCCRREGLVSTGAFWQCRSCGLRITERALRFEQAGAAHHRLQSEEHRHGQRATSEEKERI